MAQRRMISKKITDTDKFIDMPLSSQALYFHLNISADDEGFIDRAKTVQRTIGASDDDMKILIAKGFIIPFESGVVVIRHWRIHNYIQTDRFQPTLYQEEKQQLEFDKTKTASLKAFDKCIQNVSKMETQVRLEENRLEENRLEENNILSGKPDYAFPEWLTEKSITAVKKGNPENYDFRIPIAYLNQIVDTNYKYIDKNTKLVKARFRDGFILDDFKAVIDKKADEWLKTDMSKYLRPETLFGSKFESYLNQPEPEKSEYDDLF